MKVLNEKKGFTLIELLAVIVVLAIVMVLATTTVLPYMTRATRNAFATEANTAIDAASQAMSLIQIGSISGSELIDSGKYKKTENKDDSDHPTVVTSISYCFTVEKLVDLGLWTKDKSEVDTSGGNTPTYEGVVVVTETPGSKAYSYAIEMHNKDLYVNSSSGNISESDVSDFSSSVELTRSCPL